MSGSRLPRQLVHHCANAVQQNVARESREGGGSDQPRAAECCNPTPAAPRPTAYPRTHTRSALSLAQPQPRAAERSRADAELAPLCTSEGILTMRARPLCPASGLGPSAALPTQSTPVLAEANSYGGRRKGAAPQVAAQAVTAGAARRYQRWMRSGWRIEKGPASAERAAIGSPVCTCAPISTVSAATPALGDRRVIARVRTASRVFSASSPSTVGGRPVRTWRKSWISR